MNCWDPDAETVATDGETDTATGAGAALTTTTAVAVIDGSAVLAATTWKVPATAGAVYRPPASIRPPGEPSTTRQETPTCAEVAAAVAVKGWVPAGGTVAEGGRMLIPVGSSDAMPPQPEAARARHSDAQARIDGRVQFIARIQPPSPSTKNPSLE
ncbi:MAG TPA: hypothetical protein PLL32_01400 [Anaeromyxobacteraceae bacterium]|nr:hypothetical protein [Anaeromyxobacteraceae bacterium]